MIRNGISKFNRQWTAFKEYIDPSDLLIPAVAVLGAIAFASALLYLPSIIESQKQSQPLVRVVTTIESVSLAPAGKRSGRDIIVRTRSGDAPQEFTTSDESYLALRPSEQVEISYRQGPGGAMVAEKVRIVPPESPIKN